MPDIDSKFESVDPEWSLPRQKGSLSGLLLEYARSKVIPDLESRYGRRDASRRLAKIVFCESGPYCEHPQGSQLSFAIALSPCCNREPVTNRTIFQLCHECLHALKPVPFGSATVLEEGLAAENSLRPFGHSGSSGWLQPEYKMALAAVERLRGLVDLDSCVKAFRADPHRSISEITDGFLRKYVAVSHTPTFDRLLSDIPAMSSFECWRATKCYP